MELISSPKIADLRNLSKGMPRGSRGMFSKALCAGIGCQQDSSGQIGNTEKVRGFQKT